jgi:hypothetical protein
LSACCRVCITAVRRWGRGRWRRRLDGPLQRIFNQADIVFDVFLNPQGGGDFRCLRPRRTVGFLFEDRLGDGARFIAVGVVETLEESVGGSGGRGR